MYRLRWLRHSFDVPTSDTILVGIVNAQWYWWTRSISLIRLPACFDGTERDRIIGTISSLNNTLCRCFLRHPMVHPWMTLLSNGFHVTLEHPWRTQISSGTLGTHVVIVTAISSIDQCRRCCCVLIQELWDTLSSPSPGSAPMIVSLSLSMLLFYPTDNYE
jgi:hypothetical protein